jgi:hypothetical protein
MDARPGTPYPELPMDLKPPCCKDRPAVAEPCPTCSPGRPRGASLQRQLTNDKWEAAEDYLREHPEIAKVLAGEASGHKYWMIRADDGTYQRVHEVLNRVSPSHK